jgi:flagellar biosynthesis/type III secretory pathway M-ring protein FliF/YscJ
MLSILILFPFILPSAIALVSSFIIEPVLKKYTGSVNQKTRAASSESESGEESTESETSESETDGESTEGEGSEETEEENNSVDEWYME